MKLFSNIPGISLLLQEREDVIEFFIFSSLEPRGIVENKAWVALEGERAADVMYASL